MRSSSATCPFISSAAASAWACGCAIATATSDAHSAGSSGTRSLLDSVWRGSSSLRPPRVPVANVIGLIHEYESPGYVAFELNGVEMRLRPVYESAEHVDLFFIFRDATSGRTTYPAGRFLHTPLPVDGRVDLDFNRAYSPPCAFTAHATCPLPPQENWLHAAIEAGEKDPGIH